MPFGAPKRGSEANEILVSNLDGQADVDLLLDRLSRAADVYLRGRVLSEAPFLPAHLRSAIVEMSSRLARVLDALFEARALCDDADVLEAMAETQHSFGELGAPRSRDLVDSDRLRLEAAWPSALSKFANEFNEILQVASADEEPVDLTRIVSRSGGRFQCLVIRLKDASISSDTTEMQHDISLEASRLPRQWRPMESSSERSLVERREQFRELRDCMQKILEVIATIHGPALLALMDRHNAMLQNFERRSPS